MLIGNKLDLKQNRQVATDIGAAYAKKNNLAFLETSAMNGENVE